MIVLSNYKITYLFGLIILYKGFFSALVVLQCLNFSLQIFQRCLFNKFCGHTLVYAKYFDEFCINAILTNRK